MLRIHHSRGLRSARPETELAQLTSRQLGGLAGPLLHAALDSRFDTRSLEILRLLGQELQCRELRTA
jgi:hypothetical protein